MKNVKRKSVAMLLVAVMTASTIFMTNPGAVRAAGTMDADDPYSDLEWWENLDDPYIKTITVASDESTGFEGYTVSDLDDYRRGWWVSLPEGYTGTVTFEVTSTYKELDFSETIWTYLPDHLYNWRVHELPKSYFVTEGYDNSASKTKLTIPIKNYDKGSQYYNAWFKYDGKKKTRAEFIIAHDGEYNPEQGIPYPVPTTWPSIVDPDKQPGSETVEPDPTPTPEPVPSPAPVDSPIIEEAADGTVVVKDGVDATGKSKVSKEVVSEGTMYRMYDPNRGEHMYTKNASEMQQLVSLGWQHEASSDFNVISATEKGATPVYRVYNPNDGGMHFYTQDAAEAKGLAAGGWTYEGISHYVYAKDSGLGTPQYRLYNPNSTNGEHNWTTSVAERDALIAAGWQSEDVCWNIK